jgi:glycosyltransferase involved in cell wall biosynthesis
VLPSTGEFDSRTYRIATTCLARGHRVTVLARWKDGLPEQELHPAGYTIIRIKASAADGLPLKGARSAIGGLLHPGRKPASAKPKPATPSSTTSPAVSSAAVSDSADPVSDAAAKPAAPARKASLPRRVINSTVRRFAIPLTIRSHVKNAKRVAPAADLYHGMAYMGIPVALALGKQHKAPVVYDARDIYLEARNLAKSRGIVRWALARAERGWAHASGRVITVNDAYADVMAERLRVKRPLVVMNCSMLFDPPEPPEHRFHAALGLAPDAKVVLYHGGLFPERGIEQLMAAMRQVPEAELVLMGYGVLEPELRAAAADPASGGRVHVMAAVPPQDLHAWVASADVAAMAIQASTLNHRLTTPNKLFEAMAAAVPVVSADLPGMATIVREVDFGRLCDPADPASIADAIRSLLAASPEEIARLRANARHAAHERYNWEAQAELLLAEYQGLTGTPW